MDVTPNDRSSFGANSGEEAVRCTRDVARVATLTGLEGWNG